MPGWHAALDLRFGRRGDRTVLTGLRHHGPLRVQRPFYPEAGLCHTYLLHPPGGMVGGDELSIGVRAGAGSEVLLTTPAAGKFYRSLGQPARQCQRLSVAAGACCEWLPQENILFDGALSACSTDVALERGARFIGWEISGFGRPAADAPYRRGRHDQRFALYRSGELFYLDRLQLDGAGGAYRASWGLQGHNVSGLLVATPADEAALEAAREAMDAWDALGAGACTLIGDVLLCRRLSGKTGDGMTDMRRCMTALWRRLRPPVIGREPCAPRIWLT